MKLTQKELAKHLQIADSTLSYWEMGKYEPDSEALIKLSRFFKVPIDYIIGGDFAKWDIDVNKTLNLYEDSSHLDESYLSVSEHIVEYNLNNEQSAFNRVEFNGLTQEEIDLLSEYALFIKSRRKNESLDEIKP
ncbi:MAG: helix-turn-helix domain-containing protein [Oscillospiraceae bacterium]|nr:helix-turn-helix domain-containing protein [Oscillospiraceae bacterium]